jgi:hypothetical protein
MKKLSFKRQKILGGARIVESQFKFKDLFDGSNI